MAKLTRQLATITDAARDAGKQLSAWAACEQHAKNLLNATKDTEVTGDFAEVRFQGGDVTGVIKVGNVVLKIQS